MSNRSNINLVGNTVTGQNLGSGAHVFKGKNTANNMQFRTIQATGSSMQVIQTADKILLYALGGSGGTVYNFTNGLTESIGTVALGGALNSPTIFTGSTVNHLKYSGDYGAGFTARSIPDAAWVTGHSGGGGGFLGLVTQTTTQPSGLKDNQWVKPAPTNAGVFNYTFSTFVDSGATAIHVNLSLEDVYLRYCSSGYWVKESYNKPITSGRTWVGNSSCAVCEVPVINEWVLSESALQYTGQKFAYDTQTIMQTDVSTCAVTPNYILIKNIHLNSSGCTLVFTIPAGKTALLNKVKLMFLNNADPTTFCVAIGNNYCNIPFQAYDNLVSMCQIADVLTNDTYDITPLQKAVTAASGSIVYFNVGTPTNCNLCANLLIQGFIY